MQSHLRFSVSWFLKYARSKATGLVTGSGMDAVHKTCSLILLSRKPASATFR